MGDHPVTKSTAHHPLAWSHGPAAAIAAGLELVSSSCIHDLPVRLLFQDIEAESS